MATVVHVITGLNNGGAEAVLYRLVTNDRIYNHHVVSLMDMGTYGLLLEDAGINVTCLNMPKGRATIKGVIKLWRLLRIMRPEVVQTWMYHADFIGGIIAWLAGVRNINWGVHHTDLIRGESSRATIVIANVCAKISSFVPRSIVCCAEKSALVHARLGYKKDKLAIIGNGYQLDRFEPDFSLASALKKELGLPNFPLVGMVGRFDPLKDHRNFIKALSLLKCRGRNFLCLLVGPGVEAVNAELMNSVNKNGVRDNVVFLGQRKDIPAIMNALDVHVLSSKSEAFPNVLAEAMACGTPCVTTNVGDAKLIVGDTGWVVPPENPEILACSIEEALNEMCFNSEAWERRKVACRKRIEENFSLETMIYKYHQVWACE